jgi:MYXO-CTERM domain-containing protein
MKTMLFAAAAVSALALARDGSAFCGFYVSGADAKLFNNATQVVLMREGTRTVLSMQNSYQGPPQNFAMVVPVPVVLQKENVKTLPKEVFARIDQLDAPRLVEYWEQDPCPPPQPARPYNRAAGPIPKSAPAAEAALAKDLGVRVEAKFTVGEYDVVILSARDSNGLDTWLRQEKYKIPDGAEPYLRPYVQAGSKFFVAKVDVAKVKFEKKDGKDVAMLSPLRFHYDAETFSLPVRLGLMNSGGTQDLIVHILANGKRYEVANYPNTTIPTNFDVSEQAKTQFGAFYAALFDRTLEKIPKAIVTEYSWDAGSCDPCPSPPLEPSELAVLGGDVLPSAQQGQSPDEPPQIPYGFVLTRLHARYGKDSLGEDLVFRAASPIVGGREFMGENGKLEHGARQDSTNNFQGRYAIRHPWTGPIACKNPQRGIWGGPPNGSGGMPPTPAKDIAFAPRGKMQLATIVKGALPEAALLPGAVEPLGSPVVRVGPAPTPLPQGNASSSGGTTSATPEPKRGCGCDVPGGDAATGGAMLGAFGVIVAALRRRRTT